jgi:hypothetical protein
LKVKEMFSDEIVFNSCRRFLALLLATLDPSCRPFIEEAFKDFHYSNGQSVTNILRWNTESSSKNDGHIKLQYLVIHILFDAFHNNDWLCSMNVLFDSIQTFVSRHLKEISSMPLCTLKRLCWLYVVSTPEENESEMDTEVGKISVDVGVKNAITDILISKVIDNTIPLEERPTALDITVIQWLWKQEALLPFNTVQFMKLIEDPTKRKFWIPLIAKNKDAAQILLALLDKEVLQKNETTRETIFNTLLECLENDVHAVVLFFQCGLLNKLHTIILSALTTMTATPLQNTSTISNIINIQIVCTVLCRVFAALTENDCAVLLTHYNLIHVIIRYYVPYLNESIALPLLNLLNVFLQREQLTAKVCEDETILRLLSTSFTRMSSSNVINAALMLYIQLLYYITMHKLDFALSHTSLKNVLNLRRIESLLARSHVLSKVLSSYALAMYWKCIVDDELNLWNVKVARSQQPFQAPTYVECRRFILVLQDNFIQGIELVQEASVYALESILESRFVHKNGWFQKLMNQLWHKFIVEFLLSMSIECHLNFPQLCYLDMCLTVPSSWLTSHLIGTMKSSGNVNINSQEIFRSLLIRFSTTTQLVEVPVFINIFAKLLKYHMLPQEFMFPLKRSISIVLNDLNRYTTNIPFQRNERNSLEQTKPLDFGDVHVVPTLLWQSTRPITNLSAIQSRLSQLDDILSSLLPQNPVHCNNSGETFMKHQ